MRTRNPPKLIMNTSLIMQRIMSCLVFQCTPKDSKLSKFSSSSAASAKSSGHAGADLAIRRVSFRRDFLFKFPVENRFRGSLEPALIWRSAEPVFDGSFFFRFPVENRFGGSLEAALIWRPTEPVFDGNFFLRFPVENRFGGSLEAAPI